MTQAVVPQPRRVGGCWMWSAFQFTVWWRADLAPPQLVNDLSPYRDCRMVWRDGRFVWFREEEEKILHDSR